MKRKELKDVKIKDISEIIKSIVTKKEELLKIQLKVKIGGEKNLKKAKNLRKDIAQLKTVLHEKEIVAKEEEPVKTIKK
jgi:large subunit ribosomal protein L29